MEETELLALCKSEVRPRWKISPSQFWTAEIYSFGKYIREFGYFPYFLPLCIYTDHGAGSVDYPYEHELKSDASCQFYHSPKSVEIWKNVSSKPCYVLYSPFVFYRRKYNIEKAVDARGTIAFPAHTTPVIDDYSDVEIYIKQLLALPEKFQPISVCLHMHDINKGHHKIFLKYKIPVYTAGNSLDDRFVERFYAILQKFSYATSNMVGSYLYYTVEMGIPFSIYGNKPFFINKGDPNVRMGEYDPLRESVLHRKIHEMFNGLNMEITPEQKELVEIELGLRDGISRSKMAYVLYASLFRWVISISGLKFIASSIKEKVRMSPLCKFIGNRKETRDSEHH